MLLLLMICRYLIKGLLIIHMIKSEKRLQKPWIKQVIKRCLVHITSGTHHINMDGLLREQSVYHIITMSTVGFGGYFEMYAQEKKRIEMNQ